MTTVRYTYIDLVSMSIGVQSYTREEKFRWRWMARLACWATTGHCPGGCVIAEIVERSE